MTVPSPQPYNTFPDYQPICASTPAGPGLYDTGIPGVEVAAFEKWIVVSSPQHMWAFPFDLDQRDGGFIEWLAPVILVIDIEMNKFWNTGLIGWRPEIARTPDGAVTIAFEVDEEMMWPPGIPPAPPPITGYPYMNQGGCSCCTAPMSSQDANGDGDYIDRVIVLYTWEPAASSGNQPPKGYTRILAPPGTNGNVDVFTRASLSGNPDTGGGWLTHEFSSWGNNDAKSNPAAIPIVPWIYVWDLSGFNTSPGGGPLTQQIYSTPAPAPAILVGSTSPAPPPTIDGGFRPHVAANIATEDPPIPTAWLVFEQNEALNFGSDQTGDGDTADYLWKRWMITGAENLGTIHVGHPSSMACPMQCSTVTAARRPVLGLPLVGAEGNLTSTMGDVAGIPNLETSFNPPHGTHFGDDAIRYDPQYPGVVALSRFNPPVAGSGAERETLTCQDENVGFALIALGTTTIFSTPRGRGLYPTISGNVMAFTKREYALNPPQDLNGDGGVTSLVQEIVFAPSTGTIVGSRYVGCGYGPTLETHPGFSLPSTPPFAVSQVTAFLTPEICVYCHPAASSCAPGCGPGVCIYTIRNGSCIFGNPPLPGEPTTHACAVNLNACYPGTDMDACDIIVRYDLK